MKSSSLALLIALAVVGCDQGGPAALDGDTAGEEVSRATLRVLAETGEHTFRVEVADTEGKRAKGLMYRSELAPDAGMLFDFEESRLVSMWMKNTYVPLDMLFIRADGTIARIAENTEPHSLASIPSGEPVLAVLEVAGGTAARLGIKAGDRVAHSLFGGG